MSEIKNEIFNLVAKFIDSNSAVLAVIYTIGHIMIAMICIKTITGASMDLAAIDAIVEPMINGVWFYVLHNTYNKVIARKNTLKEYSYS